MNESIQQQSEHLAQLVVQTRRRLRRNAVLSGLGLLVVLAVGWLTAGAALDMLAALSVSLRVTVWAIFWVLVLVSVTAMVVWPAVRPMGVEKIAFRIERVLGGMHNRLVTVMDLRRAGRLDPRSEPFASRLVQQTTQRLADYSVDHVADPRRARRWSLGAALTLALALALALLLPERMPVSTLRLLMPTSPIPPGSSITLRLYPGDVEVLQGEPLRVWATVEGGQVEHLMLRLRSVAGKWLNYPMQPEGEGQFAFTLSAVNTSYDYRVEGGGTWTLPKRITMVRRPVVEKLVAKVCLPDYMKLPQPRPVDERASQISAPVGSTIRLTATVSGDVAEGQIDVFEMDRLAGEQTDLNETVWFDDDLPPDSELMGEWRWTSERSYSGTRAHTFGWARRPYGFRSRLNRLRLGRDETLFLYVWLDPDNPPGRLTVRVAVRDKTYELGWDSQVSPLEKKQKEQLHYYGGRLPAAGSWQRLEVPGEKLMGKNAKSVELAGLSFDIEGGVILFDRAGTLRPVVRSVERAELKRVASLPMERDQQTGRWVGAVAAQNIYIAVSFRNRLGHPSATMKAIPVIATADEPPTVVVERPGRNLTISQPQNVPLVIRAFDDYGVGEVSVQTGPDADTFGDLELVARYEEPKAARLAVGSVDTQARDLKPGRPLYYRVLVSDLKGQQVVSDVFRIELAESKPDGDQELGPVPDALADILEDMGRLVESGGQLSAAATELLAILPEGLVAQVDETGVVRLLNPDGTPMTAEQIKELLARWNEGLSDEERRQLEEMRQQIQKERQELLALSERFDEAAKGQQSMLALPAEAEALRAMGERIRQMAEMMPSLTDGEALDEDVLARLMGLQGLSSEQQGELTQLQQQLQQLMAARQTLATSPAESQQQLAAIIAQLQAQQAMRQMRTLDSYLQSQQELFQQLQQQVAELRRQTQTAVPQDLDSISGQQEELDPEALDLIRRAQELLQQRLTKMRERQEMLPPPPWQPPGRRQEAMPVEADTPEEEPQQNKAGPDLEAAKKQLDELEEQSNLEWWDQPVLAPPTAFTLEANARFAGRDSRPTPPPRAHAATGMPTPRQMLMEHQDRLQQALTANSNELGGVQDQLSRMMSQLQQPTSEGAGLLRVLDSEGVRQAMGMAAWAATNATGVVGLRHGVVIDIGLDAFELPSGGSAALYRLPPGLRQSLVQGMQERGPEAYQPLIDAYYRQLSEEIEK